MSYLETLRQSVLSVLVFLSTIATCFILTLPKPFDAYTSDRIVEILKEDEQKTGESTDEHGFKWKHQDGIRYLKLEGSVQIVVLGDIGRSPRMQYHAISIAKHVGRVDIVGYHESDVHPELEKHPLINIVPISPAPRWLRTSNPILFLLLGPLKVLLQVRSLYRALGYRTRPAKWMLVQIPPSIPTLAVCLWTSFWRNSTLVLDWHNLAPSLLALKHSPRHPLVHLARLHERLLARHASHHLAVSAAMARLLRASYNIPAAALHVLHDRPHDLFRPLANSQQRAAFLRRCPQTAQHADDLLAGRWRLLVSATSWTPDEDFGLLLAALVAYSAAPASRGLPPLLVVVTGKGPLQQRCLNDVAALNQPNRLSRVVVATAFLPVADYAALLASADLGVSLHTSSSGVDLPMKVLDMFGAGLPVVGWGRFEAWPELVQEGVNGRGFGSKEELAGLLIGLFGGGGKENGVEVKDGELETLREGAKKESERRWDAEWDPVAGKLLRLVR